MSTASGRARGRAATPPQQPVAVLDLQPARPDDPDALALTEEVQAYRVELFSGADEDPREAPRSDPSDASS